MSDLSIANKLNPAEAPLSSAQEEIIAERVAKVREIFPELSKDVKALKEAGLIRGWRDLAYIGPPRDESREVGFDCTQIVIHRPPKTAEAHAKR